MSMRKAGRPTKFDKAMLVTARVLCELGATDEKIAEGLGVSVATLNSWKQSHPEFLKVLQEGKAQADAKVERALFERACGYRHEAVDIRTVSRGDGMSEIVQTEYTKVYAPDPTSCIFWLKNRKPKEWREKVEVADAGGGPLGTGLAVEIAKAIIAEKKTPKA